MPVADGDNRRSKLLQLLTDSPQGATGTQLAHALGVSRQVIVQDIALLRVAGHSLFATTRGYVLVQPNAHGHRATLAVRHSRDATRDELNVLVDHGVRVLDAVVEHPIYGEVRAPLLLSSRADVNEFVERMETTHAPLLADLTDGVHLHTVEAASAAQVRQAAEELRQRGYLIAPELVEG